ncbi:hypothetical protein BU15DRAFT_75489 [Melanogaster broomeanus]|nr:hypothetical protein BU15DRAFT_75489 [Melanogaster broomeanus]
MLIRLVPPSPHPTILYGLTFPKVLPLPHLNPNTTVPAAWASQLHLLTSILQLEHPSSIHMFDRAVGLVARVHEVCLDVPRKEITVVFVDERVTKISMNPDCVRMLVGVADDVRGCKEPDGSRNSLEGSTCTSACGSIASSTEDLPSSGGSPAGSQKPGKHKRQRSLLFSLISSLVPRSLSPSPPSPIAPTPPPPTPLPPIPVIPHMRFPPISPQQIHFPSTPNEPSLLRRRARATLIDAWRLHVIPALSPHHIPPGGYIEWILIAMASKTRAEIKLIEAERSHCSELARRAAAGSKHRRTQSECRTALDLGDRNESEGGRWRAPSPFPGQMDAEGADDRVVYPRQEQADEWGVRCAQPSESSDDLDAYAFEFNDHNESLLREQFASGGDDWDNDDRFTFEFDGMGRHHSLNIDSRVSRFDDRHIHFDGDFGGDYVLLRLQMSTTTRIQTDSQTSLRTPEEGDELPLTTPAVPPELTKPGARSQQRSAQLCCHLLVRLRILNGLAHQLLLLIPAHHDLQFHLPLVCLEPVLLGEAPQIDEVLASQVAFLGRICVALDLVRTRCREEGWRLIRATLIGAPTGWMDAEAERSLELKAKRRAWSAGIKISAPYYLLRLAARPPWLHERVHGMNTAEPIVPTGLSLGIPVQRSPLALYVWGAGDARKSTPSKYGALSLVHTERMPRSRPSRVSFPESPTKLFPVCEEENEDFFEPVKVDAVTFPLVELEKHNDDATYAYYKHVCYHAYLLYNLLAHSPDVPSSYPSTIAKVAVLAYSDIQLQDNSRPSYLLSSQRRTLPDLSQAYAAPPPDGPLVVSAAPAPHEQYPRYAHVHSPMPVIKKGASGSALGGAGREVVFEQAGSEFTVGLEVALGRAEERNMVW